MRSFFVLFILLIGSFIGLSQAVDNPFESAQQIDPNKRDGKGYLEFGMKQSDIEDAILQLYQEKYPSIRFKKVILTSDKFYYQRDSDYQITYRLMNADILVEENGVCRAYDITVKQKRFYKNYGVFEEERLNGFYPISCSGW